MREWNELAHITFQLIVDRFEELTALHSDDPKVQEELASARRLLEAIEKANEPKPAPTRYGKPSLEDLDKPGNKWGNA